MPIQRILALLLNNPRVIQALSETRPIRAAAKFTAYLFLRGKQAIEEEARRPKIVNRKRPPEASSSSQKEAQGRFADTFKDELRKGLREWQQKNKPP